MNQISKQQLASMGDLVAQAIHQTVVGDSGEVWDSLSEAERHDFRMAAYAAVGAHDAWLTLHGYAVVKLEGRSEGRAPLATPPTPTLLGPDGKPVN